MTDTVDDRTWEMSMDTLTAAARLLSALPLDKMQRTTEVADSIGSILHPTEYRRALEEHDWEGQKALIKAAREFVRVFQAIEDSSDTPITT
jgi:hypothetical protein